MALFQFQFPEISTEQQDDELQCDITGSDAQEMRSRKFFVLMKSLFDNLN